MSADAVVLGLLARLPGPAQRLLAGGRPLRRDGLTLDPEMQLALALMRLTRRPSVHQMTPAAARAFLSESAAAFAGRLAPVARVEALEVPGPAGSMRATLYVPPAPGERPALLVYYHGGGWVVGGLDTHEAPCRLLAQAAGVAVLAVDYRRAPEARFPAAVDDALAAFRWAHAEATRLGARAGVVAVGGDSAGGNLAAVVSQLAARDGARPASQLLLYPVTDVSKKHRSYTLFAEGFFLSERDMDWYRDHYLPDAAAARDPRVSPLLAPDLRGLPPAVVLTAGFDVLRDEGEAYARRLAEAGVPVAHRRIPGQIHGFANMTSFSRSAHAAMTEAARTLAQLLA